MSRAQLTSTVEQNTGGAVAPFVAGKNKIINGDFGIWQRGTSVTTTATGWFYGCDRFRQYSYSASTATISQQTFTPGTAPVAGYESQYFARALSTSTSNAFGTSIENVQTFAGQTTTLSFWAKSASAQTLANVYLFQNFGTGGSAAVSINATPPAITTSWARYSFTFTVPSIAGKTIGAGSYILLYIEGAVNNALDTWGWQLEAGSVATPFTTATGTVQGELAACQRYYYRITAGAAYGVVSTQGVAYSTTSARIFLPLKSTMRSVPLIVEYANLIFNDGANLVALGTLVSDAANGDSGCIIATTTSLTAFRPYAVTGNNNAAGYLALSAEL